MLNAECWMLDAGWIDPTSDEFVPDGWNLRKLSFLPFFLFSPCGEERREAYQMILSFVGGSRWSCAVPPSIGPGLRNDLSRDDAVGLFRRSGEVSEKSDYSLSRHPYPGLME